MLVKRAAELEKLKTVDALWAGAVQALAASGFDHAIYLTVTKEFSDPYVRCTLPGLYDDTPPETDPFLRYSCQTYDILFLGNEFLHTHPYVDTPARRLIKRAAEGGVTAALGIPMRLYGSGRFGGFVVGTGLDRAAFMARIAPLAEEVRLFCLIIHRRIEELSEPAPVPDPDAAQAAAPAFRDRLMAPDLTPAFDNLAPREREVIYLLARGRSRAEAAAICGISVHTVSDYAKAGYRKLGVRNRAQAAALIYAERPPLDE